MNIYVGNIPYTLTENELNDLFAEYGSVTSTKIITERETGRSKGFGFVEMESDEAGKEAIEKLDGFIVKGRNLRVNEARPRANNSKPFYNKGW